MTLLLFLLIIILAIRLIIRPAIKSRQKHKNPEKELVQSSQIKQNKTYTKTSLKAQLRTVLVFTKLSAKRFLRDRLAQFFTILFPLIFLFVFGSLTKNEGSVSFKVALINNSTTNLSRSFIHQLDNSKTFKIQTKDTTLKIAENSLMSIVLLGIGHNYLRH